VKKIVGVTACITGIAHTYLAAESLIEAGKLLGVDIKIETHGAIGIENRLNRKDIDEAIGVIIASDVVIDETHFIDKKVIKVNTHEAIQHPKKLILSLMEGKES
jgi:PTS system fructose-specific IIC component